MVFVRLCDITISVVFSFRRYLLAGNSLSSFRHMFLVCVLFGSVRFFSGP